MDLFVGLAGFRGKIERYRFDLLEFAVTPTLPKSKVLRGFREAKPRVVFSLRTAPSVLEGGADAEDNVERTIRSADALAARFVVLPSGPRFTPTTRNKTRLVESAQRLAAEGRVVAWEPRGVWEEAELAAWAEEAGVTIVRDLTRDDHVGGDVAYTRLLPFGTGARLTQNGLEKLVERLEPLQEAFVIVASEGAVQARTRLREWLGVEGAEA